MKSTQSSDKGSMPHSSIKSMTRAILRNDGKVDRSVTNPSSVASGAHVIDEGDTQYNHDVNVKQADNGGYIVRHSKNPKKPKEGEPHYGAETQHVHSNLQGVHDHLDKIFGN